MSRPVLVDLFAEDRAHEALLGPLVRRIAREEGVAVDLRIRSARGGHARALQEFRDYQKLVEKGAIRGPGPDLLVVAIDGNCATFTKKRTEIEGATRTRFQNRLIAACPDPHVERWFVADPDSFHTVVGHRPTVGRQKCARDHYKQMLAKAVRDAGHPPTLGGVEFAVELVDAMDLYRAGKGDGSLRAFVDDLRGKLHGFARSGRGVAG